MRKQLRRRLRASALRIARMAVSPGASFDGVVYPFDTRVHYGH